MRHKIFAIHFRGVLIIAVLMLLVSDVLSQVSETVNSKSVTAYEGKSYVYKAEVKFLPGFSVSAQTNGEFFCRNLYNQPPNQDQNFVRTETILFPGILLESQIAPLPVEQKTTVYQYIDGLGRNLQTVTVEGSPLKADVVIPFEYDQYGRQLKESLPYSYTDVKGKFRGSASSEQEGFYTTPPTAVASSFAPWKQNVFEASPLIRAIDVVSPRDDSWNATAKKVTTYTKLNVTAEVTFWKDFISGLPEKNGTHGANTLMVQETTDEDGQITKAYQNLRGQTVMNRVGDGTTWFDTHYIYSPSGLVMFVIQPEGVNRLATEFDAGGADKQSFLDRWAFQYQYDNEQRVIAKRVPGVIEGNAGWTYLVYDKWNRLALTQDAVQRLTNEYSFTKYDRFNRPIMTGLCTTLTPLATLRTDANAPTERTFETEINNATGYTLTSSFPTAGISESNLLTVTYYDNYSFVNYTGWDAEGNSFAFVNVPAYPQNTDVFTTVKGQTTGSKTRVLGQTRWLNSVTHYDTKYLPIQVITENHMGGTIRTTSKFDFVGRTEKDQQFVSVSTLTVQNRYLYDHAGRILSVYHQVNSQPEVLMAANEYNELGQLIDKNIHSTDGGVTFLQSVDYRYNVRGWLTSINNSALSNGGNNDDSNDLFGMELEYYTNTPAIVAGTFNQKNLYNGNISAIKWKTDTKQEIPSERIYAFDYDILNRLKQAYHATKIGSTWTGEPNMFNEQVTDYDKNGNIRGIVRNANVQGAQATIDNLSYTYALSGKESNRLVAIEDATNHTLGFKPAPASVTEEFQYDNSGNLRFDHNKGISQILYNHLNLPKEIQFTRPGGQIDKIEYTYDATGIKLTKLVRVNGTQVWKTDYVAGIQYDNNTLSFFATPEGRATINNGTYEYEYFYKDHQGNVRLAYGPLKETLFFRATMENPATSSLGADEQNTFQNIAATRHADPAFNYTKSSEQVLAPDKSARVNSFTGTGLQPIGPAKSLRVLTGDKVYMETFARYNLITGSSSVIATSALVSAVTGSFGVVNSGETATLWQSFNNNLSAVSGAMGAANTVTPKAYLVWIYFNDAYVYVRSGGQAITTSAYNAFEKLSRSFTAEQNGYLYIYVANESSVSSTTNVHFDETYIVHEKNNVTLQVTQASDYYPFGLSFNEYNADRLKEVSAGNYEPTLRNRYKFQGQELQKDLDLGWYQFKWRMHDPAIGRFGAVDPLSDKYLYNSTYAFSENKLISHVELEGLEAEDSWAAWFGALKAATESRVSDPGVKDYLGTLFYGGTDMGQGLMNTAVGIQRESSSKVDQALNMGEKIQNASSSGDNPNQIIKSYKEEQSSGRNQAYTGMVQTTLASSEIQMSLFGGALMTPSFNSFANYGYSAAKGVTVVGEGMARVEVAASKIPGAKILNDMPKFTGTADQVTSQMMTYNRQWILQQMRSGRPILDIGRDLNRANPSIFYQMEQNMMKNYLKLHPNSFQIIKP